MALSFLLAQNKNDYGKVKTKVLSDTRCMSQKKCPILGETFIQSINVLTINKGECADTVVTLIGCFIMNRALQRYLKNKGPICFLY